MDETSGCGARRALNARERSGDATSGDERRRDEARAKPVERGKSEAQVRDFCSRRITSPLDQVLEKGRSRAAGLTTYQFLRSSTSALLREPARLRERCRWLALSPERRAQRRRVSRTGAGASRYCPRCEPLLPTLPMGGVVPHQNPVHKLRDRDRRSQHTH